jgi:hypothetical protein
MATTKEEDFVVRYTNKDIMSKLDSIETKIDGVRKLSNRAMITATGAGMLVMTLLVALLQHLGK